MRKWLVFIGIILCVLTLVSCTETEEGNEKVDLTDESQSIDSDAAEEENVPLHSEKDTEWTDNDPLHPSVIVPVRYSDRFIRTDGYLEGASYPSVKIIRSVGELNAYYESYRDVYYLDHVENPEYHGSIGFADACKKYDEAYFKDRILLMVLVKEESGSIRHSVKRMEMNDGKMIVSIDSIVPGACTKDVAIWHILLEPEAGIELKEDDVIVFLDGKRANVSFGEVETGNTVTIIRPDIMIHSGPGYDYEDMGTLIAMGTHTITEQTVCSDGITWGKLKSGLGWINLDKAAEEAPHIPITLERVKRGAINETECHLYVREEGDYTQYLRIRAYEKLTDVRLTIMDFTDDGFQPGMDLYTLDELSPNKPLVIGVVFYGDFTTFCLSFSDAMGKANEYMIYTSGRNGAVILQKTVDRQDGKN